MVNKSKKQSEDVKMKQLSFSFQPQEKEKKINNIFQIEEKIQAKSVSEKTRLKKNITIRFIKHSEALDW